MYPYAKKSQFTEYDVKFTIKSTKNSYFGSKLSTTKNDKIVIQHYKYKKIIIKFSSFKCSRTFFCMHFFFNFKMADVKYQMTKNKFH